MLRMGRKRGLLLLWLVVFLLLAVPLYGQSILTQAASGTGFIVGSDGYILTNKHVINGATKISVTIGGKEYEAKVVDSLSDNDIALLKIDAHGLPTVMLGDSDKVQIGDTVYAIGCPAGVCGTITAGRIANLGISSKMDEGTTLHNLIMSDLTTTHGSSGGPLLNDKGEVIGITTAGVVVQGETTGFGFSIPINQAIPLLRQVPSFSTSQMGRATVALPLQEVRQRCGRAVSLVESTTEIPLASLLPKAALGVPLARDSSPLSNVPGAEGIPIDGVAGVEGGNWRYQIKVLQFATAAQAQDAAHLLMSDRRIQQTGESCGEQRPWWMPCQKYCTYWRTYQEREEQYNDVQFHYIIRSLYDNGAHYYNNEKRVCYSCDLESPYNVESGFAGEGALTFANLLFLVSYTKSTCVFRLNHDTLFVDQKLDENGALVLKSQIWESSRDWSVMTQRTEWAHTGLYFNVFVKDFIGLTDETIAAAKHGLGG